MSGTEDQKTSESKPPQSKDAHSKEGESNEGEIKIAKLLKISNFAEETKLGEKEVELLIAKGLIKTKGEKKLTRVPREEMDQIKVYF